VNGVTGILVPPRDHVSLAGAIKKILSSKELCTRMGEAGRARVLAAFDERTIVALQIEHINHAVAEKLQKRKLQK
jgi:glycosyltransferase involved in cell wall biosynthesis